MNKWVMSEEINITKISLAEITPADYNPRQISDTDKEKLTKSLEEFGVVDPIIINLKDNTIIGGHQRFDILYNQNPDQEAHLLKLGDIGWLFTDSNLKIKDKNHEKALNLALNRINAEWDFTKLTPLLDELQPFKAIEFTGFDVKLKNITYEPLPRIVNEDNEEVTITSEEYENNDYDDSELIIDEPISASDFPKQEEEIIPEVIEIEEEPTSNTTKHGEFIEQGDIYKLGNNIIMLGDYKNEEDKETLINSWKRYKHQMTYGKDIVKIATSKEPMDFFITDNPNAMEDQIWDYEVTTDEKALHLNPKYEQEEEEIQDYIW